MLFKILHGDKSRISTDITPYHEGYCYVTHDGDFYVDMNNERVKLNAKNAELLCGMSYDDIKSYIDRAVADKANVNHEHDDQYYTEAEIDAKLDLKADFSTVSSNYNESIIGLSVDGNVVTYIKGDGSTHTFVTQDTDTTYSLATDEVTGLTKLYATTGNAEDGTMTQKAIKTELDKKVGVTIDDSSDTLIFTI